jgi:hypothetical protein
VGVSKDGSRCGTPPLTPSRKGERKIVLRERLTAYSVFPNSLLLFAANHRLNAAILSRMRGRRPSSLTSGQVVVDGGCA